MTDLHGIEIPVSICVQLAGFFALTVRKSGLKRVHSITPGRRSRIWTWITSGWTRKPFYVLPVRVSTACLIVIDLPPELWIPPVSPWRSMPIPLPSSDSKDSPASNFQLMHQHTVASWRDLIIDKYLSPMTLTQFLSNIKMNFSVALMCWGEAMPLFW